MDTTTAIAKRKTVHISRELDLPVAKAWDAFTKPEDIKKWWGPEGFSCPSSTISLQPGGKYLHCMRSDSGQEFWSTGIFKEIVPYKKLVCTDSFSDENGNVISAKDLNMPGDWPLELLITVTFEEAGNKTKLELAQVAIPEEMYDECIKGWQQCIDKLEKNLA